MYTKTGRSNQLEIVVSSTAPRSLTPLEVPGVRAAGGVQALDRLAVADPREGRLDPLERRKVALQHLELRSAAFERAANDVTDECFLEVHVVVRVRERHLGLDHPELGQVTAGLRLLGPEGRPEAIDLAERRTGAFDIQLPGLRQERALAEVVGLEERSRGFADRAGQNRRVDTHEITLVEEVVDRLLDLGAHPEPGPLHVRPQPQVTVVQQELDAVLLRLDRELLAGADQLDPGHGQLVSAGRAGVGAHHAAERDAALLRERGGQLPDVIGKLRFDHHSLHHACPIAQYDERDARMHAQGGDPPGNGDRFARVARQISDGHGLGS